MSTTSSSSGSSEPSQKKRKAEKEAKAEKEGKDAKEGNSHNVRNEEEVKPVKDPIMHTLIIVCSIANVNTMAYYVPVGSLTGTEMETLNRAQEVLDMGGWNHHKHLDLRKKFDNMCQRLDDSLPRSCIRDSDSSANMTSSKHVSKTHIMMLPG